MAMANLKVMTRRTVSVDNCLNGLRAPFPNKFSERKRTCKLDEEAVHRQKDYAKDMAIVVFSSSKPKQAHWQHSLYTIQPKETGMKVRVFGCLKTDPSNPEERWRIPPSPPEVETFRVHQSPRIIIFDKRGKQLGTIIENPTPANTLEEENISTNSAGINMIPKCFSLQNDKHAQCLKPKIQLCGLSGCG